MSGRATEAPATYRPMAATDRVAVRALVAAAAHRAAVEAPAYFLQLAFEGRAVESRILVAERGAAIAGCVIFGAVAGTVATGRIHYVAVAASARGLGIGSGLCAAAVADLAAHGARNIVVEMPNDVESPAGRALLARLAFAEVAQVEDYYRDGVSLVVLQRMLPDDHG